MAILGQERDSFQIRLQNTAALDSCARETAVGALALLIIINLLFFQFQLKISFFFPSPRADKKNPTLGLTSRSLLITSLLSSAAPSLARQQRGRLHVRYHRGGRGPRHHGRLHAGQPERLQLRQGEAGLLQHRPGLEVGRLLSRRQLRPGLLQSVHRRAGGQAEHQDPDEPAQQRGWTQGRRSQGGRRLLGFILFLPNRSAREGRCLG